MKKKQLLNPISNYNDILKLHNIGRWVATNYCKLDGVKNALNNFRYDYPDYSSYTNDVLLFGLLVKYNSIDEINDNVPLCSICKRRRVVINTNWNNWNDDILFREYCSNKACIDKCKILKCSNTMINRYGISWNSKSADVINKRKLSESITFFTKRYESFTKLSTITPLFTLDDFIDKCNGKITNQYDNSILFKWHCNKCNNDFEAPINQNFYNVFKIGYARCPVCNPSSSSSVREKELVSYISAIYDGNIIENSRSVIPPNEIDIYLPDKKIAFEFDGLYWHSECANDMRGVGKSKMYHISKTNECESKNIHLIHIFESDWVNKFDIVKSRIKNLLGFSDKIYARKCQIRKVDSTESDKFQDDNHIQGHVNASINLGLYFNDELVSIMTFSKPRYNNKYEWELIRFCNKLNYTIVGGASKLFKYFTTHYNPTSIISYADRRWSTSSINVYENIGFTLIGSTNPNYYYWKNEPILYSRTSFQKHKLSNILDIYDENLSESANMYNNGYNKIYDCGNLIYSWFPN